MYPQRSLPFPFVHAAKCRVRPLIPRRRPVPAPPRLQHGHATASCTRSSQAASGCEAAVSRGSSLSMIARVTGEMPSSGADTTISAA